MPRSGCNIISRLGSPIIEDRVGRIVPRDAADGTSAPGAAAAQQDPRMTRLDPPASRRMMGLFALLEPRPLEVAVEDVPAGHGQRLLDLSGCLVLDAEDQGLD